LLAYLVSFLGEALAQECRTCVHHDEQIDECWHSAVAVDGDPCELENRCIRNTVNTDSCDPTGGPDLSDCNAGDINPATWAVRQVIRFKPVECNTLQLLTWTPFLTTWAACESQSCDTAWVHDAWNIACRDPAPDCSGLFNIQNRFYRGNRMACGICGVTP